MVLLSARGGAGPEADAGLSLPPLAAGDGLVQTFGDEFASFSPWTGAGGTWMTRYSYGGLSSYTLPTNGEEQLYTDASFRGWPGSLSPDPIGLNPFATQDGPLVITARQIPAAVASHIGGYG